MYSTHTLLKCSARARVNANRCQKKTKHHERKNTNNSKKNISNMGNSESSSSGTSMQHASDMIFGKVQYTLVSWHVQPELSFRRGIVSILLARYFLIFACMSVLLSAQSRAAYDKEGGRTENWKCCQDRRSQASATHISNVYLCVPRAKNDHYWCDHVLYILRHVFLHYFVYATLAWLAMASLLRSCRQRYGAWSAWQHWTWRTTSSSPWHLK